MMRGQGCDKMHPARELTPWPKCTAVERPVAMTASAIVIADSIAPHGGRITTLQVRFWRPILAELNTHRVMSKSAASSRAIPISKMLKMVQQDPAGPIHWGKNRSGMGTDEELTGLSLWAARATWTIARYGAIGLVWCLMKTGLVKQVANRLLEPFSWAYVVVTSTTFENFFALRDHPAAQPEMQELARSMRQAIDKSTPRLLVSGQWHLPYITEAEKADPILTLADLQRLSTARCARVSYLKHDGTPASYAEDLALYDRLVGSTPRHASPCEHQATPLPNRTDRSRNFEGWRQYRELVEQQ
jgi:hypothetical protein